MRFDAFESLTYHVSSFAGADGTGIADSSAAISAAATAACQSGGAHVVVLDAGGTWLIGSRLTVPALCDGFAYVIAPGATVKRGPSNNDNPWLMSATGQDRVRLINDGTIDGNQAAGFTNLGPAAVSFSWPGDGIAIIGKGRWINMPNTAINVIGQAAVGAGQANAGLAVQASPGDTVLHLAGPVTGLKNGAFIMRTVSTIDPDFWVVSGAPGPDITISNGRSPDGLTDTLLTNFVGGALLPIGFTAAFQISADVLAGATFIPTTDTSGLLDRQSLFIGQLAFRNCLVPGTKIKRSGVHVNSGIDISIPTQCKISANVNVAAMGGHDDFLVESQTFDDIGYSALRNKGVGAFAPGGNSDLTLAADAPPGSTTLTMNCYAIDCSRVGLIPGDMSAPAPGNANMPANDLVTDGPNNVDPVAGTYQITLATPTGVGTITAGTVLTWAVGALSGNGFSTWDSFGAFFANRNHTYRGNTYRASWSSPLFLTNLWHVRLFGNTYDEQWREFQSYRIAPSACTAVGNNVDVIQIGDDCSGATGNGNEWDHNLGVVISGNSFHDNGEAGILVQGGRGVAIYGNNSFNNGAALKHPTLQNFDPTDGTTDYAVNAGLELNGSWTFGAAGTIEDLFVGPNNLYDDQATPTQKYAIQLGQKPFAGRTTFKNAKFSRQIVATGNTAGDPTLPQQLMASLLGGITIVSGGTTNAVNDVLTLNDDCTVHAQLKVTSAPGGIADGVSIQAGGSCASPPANPVGVLSSTGSDTSATFTIADANWGGLFVPIFCPARVSGIGGAGAGGGVAAVSGAAAAPGGRGVMGSADWICSPGASVGYYLGIPGSPDVAGPNIGASGQRTALNGTAGFGGGFGGVGSAGSVVNAYAYSTTNANEFVGAPTATWIPSGAIRPPTSPGGTASTGTPGNNSIWGQGGAAGANADGGDCQPGNYGAGGGAPSSTGGGPFRGGKGCGGAMWVQ